MPAFAPVPKEKRGTRERLRQWREPKIIVQNMQFQRGLSSLRVRKDVQVEMAEEDSLMLSATPYEKHRKVKRSQIWNSRNAELSKMTYTLHLAAQPVHMFDVLSSHIHNNSDNTSLPEIHSEPCHCLNFSRSHSRSV